MVRLVLLLPGIEYLRTRWRGLALPGRVRAVAGVAGVAICVDALDGVLHFPIRIFAWLFQPDHATGSNAWRPSTVRVRSRHYDPARLHAFGSSCRQDATYNLTHRNCSSTVSNALEATLDGAMWRLKGARTGWGAFVRRLVTPEPRVAAQIRKRAVTMAWTPGLTLDHARAPGMLADPPPFAWWKVARSAVKAIIASRRAALGANRAVRRGRPADRRPRR
ncbi:hypothetical protein GQ56_0111390 [Burkholderia paludis]|nr:hypothetical protein GQ56_0111390 [Burkholderia paludis]